MIVLMVEEVGAQQKGLEDGLVGEELLPEVGEHVKEGEVWM